MIEVTLEVVITLNGPIISGTATAGGYGFDSPFAKNVENNYYFPRTHIKGRLREALITLGSYIKNHNIDLLFGTESKDKTGDAPLRGSMIFSDFTNERTPAQKTRTRIRMNSERGAVDEGAYQVIESPFDTGEAVEFKGTITYVSKDDSDAESIKNLIEKGLRWIPAFGGHKTVGFGHTKKVSVECKNKKSIPNPNQKLSDNFKGTLFPLSLEPEAPFCIADQKIDDNFFESESIIPGSTIKGTVAATLNYILGKPLDNPLDKNTDPIKDWSALIIHFAKIRFCHGIPTLKDLTTRPVFYPLSIVTTTNFPTPENQAENNTSTNVNDVLLCEGAGLINKQAPVFSIDWKNKDYEAVNDELKSLGLPDQPAMTSSILEVKNAIDTNARRTEKGKLFTIESINPENRTWHSRVDISRVPEESRAKVMCLLKTLTDFGLRFFSKTKTNVSCTLSEQQMDISVPTSPKENENLWAVTLQTPALMIPCDKNLNTSLVENPVGKNNEKNVLFTAYNNFWQEISENKLSLVRFFAKQKMMGGGYLYHRFSSGDTKDQPYNPLLLTCERSVFLLKKQDNKESGESEKLFESWLMKGLPVPQYIKNIAEDLLGKQLENESDLWKYCPFIPENGFGEIVVNMKCHKELYPGQESWEAV